MATLFHGYGYALILAKNGLGYISGDFFTNSAGTDVMITIFCDFLTIFGEKIGVFLKNQCYDQNFA
jgi:hypothetical protein